MHLRRWPELTAPCQLVQILRIVPDELRQQEMLALAPWLGDRGDSSLSEKRHLSGIIGHGIPFTWERHTEASTITLFFEGLDYNPNYNKSAVIRDLAAARKFAEELPGDVVRATHLYICSNAAEAEEIVSDLDMEMAEMVSCEVGADVRIWSDFRISPSGYGRMVVVPNGTQPSDLFRTVQRLQELGNYRNLALLGLPVAQENWHALNGAEAALGALVQDLNSEAVNDEGALNCVTEISVLLMQLSSQSGFRMRATAAYAQIVEDRLADIVPRRIEGYQSLTDFTSRRLLPAVRTCAAHNTRLSDLMNRAELCAALLRTRIETRIEVQNLKLLASLENSTRLQLSLQHMVEGLSVFALSYYAIGLFHYGIAGFAWGSRFENIIVSTLTPVVLGVSYFTIRKLKLRRLSTLATSSRFSSNSVAGM